MFKTYFLVLVFVFSSIGVHAQIQLGQDIIGNFEDKLGRSVSISADGTRIAIGAPGDNGESGYTTVYEYTNTWQQLGQVINGVGNDNSGWAVSISGDGTTVAVGAPFGAISQAGQVRIFKYNNTSWQQFGPEINGEALYDYSGWSVSINSDGTTLAIGSIWNDGSGYASGHVRIYRYNSSNNVWNQLGQDIDGEAPRDQSGFSVSINADGTTVAIGAHNGANQDAGQVRIYEYDGTSWLQLGQEINGEAASDNSGTSVSLNANGTRVAIGAPDNDVTGIGGGCGHVRVYEC